MAEILSSIESDKKSIRFWIVLSIIILTLSGFTLIASPSTWNEIFLIATLKGIASESSIEAALTKKWAGGGLISLSVPQFYPPWLLTFIAFLSKNLPLDLHETMGLLGGAQQFTLRGLSLILALFISFITYRQYHEATKSGDADLQNASQPSFSHLGHHIFLTFVLAQFGAVQQLLALLALILLLYRSNRTSSLVQGTTHFPRLFWIAVILLAFSTSITWITSSLFAFLLYGLLVLRTQKANYLRILIGLSFGVILFISHFLLFANYQNFIHSFNLNWLFGINMLSKEWSWQGSSILWKIISFTMSLCSVWSLYSRPKEVKTTATDLLLTSIILASGYVILFRHATPIVEDVIVQAFLFLILKSEHLNLKKTTIAQLPFEKRFKSSQFKWFWPAAKLFAVPLSLVFIFFVIFVINQPDIVLVPELSAWLSAIGSALKHNFMHYIIALILVILSYFILLFTKLTKPNKTKILRSILIAMTFYIGSNIRSFCLWDQYQLILSRIPQTQSIFYLPAIAPFIAIKPAKQKSTMAVIEHSVQLPPPAHHQISLILPSSVSDLCRAMNWKIEHKHGIFTVCTMFDDSLWKLVPLN